MLFRMGLFISLFSLLVGCSAALVPYSDDPNKKLSQAYYLMNQDRVYPARRLGEQALEGFTELGDKFGMAEAHVFLASLYKKHAVPNNPDFHNVAPDFDPKNGKAVFHAESSIDLFSHSKHLTQVAKAEFVLANFYVTTNNQNKACPLYDKSLINYEKGIKLESESGFDINNPHYDSFPSMVKAFKQNHCQSSAA